MATRQAWAIRTATWFPIERTETALEVEATLNGGKGIGGLAEIGRQALVFSDDIAASQSLAFGNGLVQRNRRRAVQAALALHFVGDARRSIRQNDSGEGAKRSAFGIKPAQPGNQIGQEILSKVIKVLAGKAKLPEQLAGRHVGRMKDGSEIVL